MHARTPIKKCVEDYGSDFARAFPAQHETVRRYLSAQTLMSNLLLSNYGSHWGFWAEALLLPQLALLLLM